MLNFLLFCYSFSCQKIKISNPNRIFSVKKIPPSVQAVVLAGIIFPLRWKHNT
ncbi:hypothetical protein KKC1_00330 [Calderihabitans maritimus]|uniref:Uncharacterized protein n=1 Tax=Calderihabitans maritimus TaxID=1246530 RepID=A0A1Z5HNG6_9FIRM|nr:hypothetical protein KKC1_00330 [Calderihabitans maritimus]